MLSYSQTLLLFFPLVSALFLLVIFNRMRASFFMAIVTLCTFLAVFMNSLDFVISHGGYVTYAFLLVTAIMIYRFLHNINIRSSTSSGFLIAFFVIVILVFEYSLSLRYGLVEVGEQVPDAAVYMEYGHWSFSLKNPYYDLINVASFWIAVLHGVYGVGDVVNAFPNLVFYIVIILLFVCSLLIAYRRFIGGEGGFDVIVYVFLIAIATPYITFITVPPSLSALYALLFISFFISRAWLSMQDYTVLIVLALAGMLTHATSMGMITFFLLSLIFVSAAVNRARESYPWGAFGVLVMVLALHTILSLARFFYTSAYVSLYPYYSDFMRFINFLLGTGELETRISRYELYLPLFTAYSWTILPGLAASYILYCLAKRSCIAQHQLASLSLLVGGLLLIGIGFAGSFFSNSFSREAGYPGYILLLLGSMEPLKSIIRERRSEAILLAMIVLALISGMYTMKNAPELYIGKVPYLTFRPPTPGECMLVKNLIVSNFLGHTSKNLFLLSSIDPGIFTVYAIVVMSPSDPREGLSLFREELTGSNQQSSLVFNTGSMEIFEIT
jgi:hypothetical protein